MTTGPRCSAMHMVARIFGHSAGSPLQDRELLLTVIESLGSATWTSSEFTALTNGGTGQYSSCGAGRPAAAPRSWPQPHHRRFGRRSGPGPVRHASAKSSFAWYSYNSRNARPIQARSWPVTGLRTTGRGSTGKGRRSGSRRRQLAWTSPRRPPTERSLIVKNVVVLASGSGTLLQALLDDPEPKPYRIAAVGSDRATCAALDRATAAGVPTFSCRIADHLDRESWNRGLALLTGSFNADLVVLAGFMKLVGPAFLTAFPDRVINVHPSLLPAFPGMHAPADALSYGVKLTGCTVFLVDGGIDAGPIVAQRAVPVQDDDEAATLHERIKVAERTLLVQVVTALMKNSYTVVGRRVSLG
jgi:phosphoribosylglycinamide formyltransferase 1